jgi:predicted MFS family arabinose efflux permease
VGLLAGIVIAVKLKPLTAHLQYLQRQAGRARNPLAHLLKVATTPRYLIGFAATMLTATGGYMIAPFAAVFTVRNLGVPNEQLPLVFMAGGMAGMIAGPLLGRLADAIGKYKVLSIFTATHIIYLYWYTRLGPSPLWLVLAAQCAFAVMLSGRISSTAALVSAVPAPPDRGAYMSVASSMQQLSGAVASLVAGLVVIIDHDTQIIKNYPMLGWIVIGTMTATWLQMRRVNKKVSAPEPT